MFPAVAKVICIYQAILFIMQQLVEFNPGFTFLPPSDLDALFAVTEVGEVWGVGRRIGQQLLDVGVKTVLGRGPRFSQSTVIPMRRPTADKRLLVRAAVAGSPRSTGLDSNSQKRA